MLTKLSIIHRLGMNGFVNPRRDPKTEEFKASIGLGAKVKMDESGNVLIKRLSKSSVYVKNSPEDSAVSNDIIKVIMLILLDTFNEICTS